MKNRSGLSKYLSVVLMGSFIFSSTVSMAQDGSFENNLVKMDVKKNLQGGVNVTLYTSKPYKDALVVNKKGDKQYVILLPEVANSLTSKPSVSSASDVLQNVEVKTQQHVQGQKGYTKIVFSATGPLDITPQVQTLKKEYQLSEREYEELISQASKKQITTVTKPTVKKEITVPRPEKIVLRSDKVTTLSQEKKQSAKVEKKELNKNVSDLAQKVVQKIQPVKTQPVQVASVKPENKAVETKSLVSQKKQAKNQEETAVKTAGPLVNPEGAPEEVPQVKGQTPEVVEQELKPQEVLIPEKPKYERKITRIKRWVKNNSYTTLGLVLVPFILLLLIIKALNKAVKTMEKQKDVFVTNLEDAPSQATDYTQDITEDMDWQEKFQTYNQINEQEPEPQIFEENPDLDNLFGVEQPQGESTPEMQFRQTSLDDFVETVDEEQEVSIEDIFGEDEIAQAQQEFFEQEDYQPEIKEKDASQLVKSSFEIDTDKGFYLVDYQGQTALIGYINDEIYVLKRFDAPVQNPIKARLSEKKGSSANYMIKVDDFKALVDVSESKMEMLIEL